MQLDRDTAEAIVRLANSRDFKVFLDFFDKLNTALVQAAIQGVDDNFSPDVLRGRAQGLAILKKEIEKAPEVAGRIQRIS